MSFEMPAMTVRILVHDSRRHEVHESVYNRFPIRLGRNPLNELPLEDPHVSQWHAIIGYMEGSLRIIDVGSRNGTLIGGRRLSSGEAVPLRGDERIEIGPFALTVTRADGAARNDTRPPRSQVSPGAWLSAPTVSYEPGGGAAEMPEVQAAREEDLQARCKPLYLTYLRAWAALCEEVRGSLDGLPPAARVSLLGRLRADYPAHPWEAEFPELAARAAPVAAQGDASHEALEGLGSLATQLLRRKNALAAPTDVRAFVLRLGTVLEVFLRYTHSLLKGFQRLEADMAIKLLGREPSPIDRARDPRDLGVRLFDYAADVQGRAPGWLESGFKNVMIQQVGLLSGAMEGVRTLLDQLSPARIEDELRDEGVRLGPFKWKTLWRAYELRHQKLAEEDKGTFEAIFGPQLSRAYVEIVGEEYAPHGSKRSKSTPGR